MREKNVIQNLHHSQIQVLLHWPWFSMDSHEISCPQEPFNVHSSGQPNSTLALSLALVEVAM